MQQDGPAEASAKHECAIQDFWISVPAFADESIYLKGLHFSNPAKQPLILFPGFYQNGFVYHLSNDTSLALYLWQNGFDVWIIHPRGTALSGGRNRKASLDDFAANDIPGTIEYVLKQTGRKPIFVGHSQGGIIAIMSLMGVNKSAEQLMKLSDDAANDRQNALKGLVVLGSFPDMTFSKPSWLISFVEEGLCLATGKRKLQLISSTTLLRFVSRLTFLASPLTFSFRWSLVKKRKRRILFFPLVQLLNRLAQLKVWKFLYHLPNVSLVNRKLLFYKTFDGSFGRILRQYHYAVTNGEMRSFDKAINYSANYHRIRLPISVVAMEYDTLADPVMMKENMFSAIASEQKSFTLWQGVGHEDHFGNARFFPWVLEAINKVG